MFAKYRMWKTSTPKLLEVIEGTETKTFCQETTCRKCVLVVPRTVKVGTIKVGNEGKPPNHCVKLCTLPLLQQVFKHTATGLNRKLTTTQQSNVIAQKCPVSAWWLGLPGFCLMVGAARFLPDGWGCPVSAWWLGLPGFCLMVGAARFLPDGWGCPVSAWWLGLCQRHGQ
jgi:hypothetical protein